jgi:hypothetical protein
MPKPINPTIGTCPCSQKGCEQVADVRRMKGGKLYLVCAHDGVIRPGGANFQDYILENASLYGAEGASPKPEPGPSPEPDTGPEIPEPVAQDNPSEKPPGGGAVPERAGNRPGPFMRFLQWVNDFSI